MKKIIVLLSVFVLLLTGCDVVKLNSNDFDKAVDSILTKRSKLSNVYFDGYKYYLPKGFKFENKDQYNSLLSDKYGNKYYLYIDAVSYYHKVDKRYKEVKTAHYSKELSYKDKFGYIEINKKDSKYFIEAMYNYAKIEAYVGENELSEAFIQICTILNSVKYNRKILESTIGDNVLNYKEETFDIFESKKKGNNTDDFLKYIEEYDKMYDKKDEMSDEDNVEIEQD